MISSSELITSASAHTNYLTKLLKSGERGVTPPRNRRRIIHADPSRSRDGGISLSRSPRSRFASFNILILFDFFESWIFGCPRLARIFHQGAKRGRGEMVAAARRTRSRRADVLDGTSSPLAAFTNPPGADSVARSAPEGGAPRTARHSAADAVGPRPQPGAGEICGLVDHRPSRWRRRPHRPPDGTQRSRSTPAENKLPSRGESPFRALDPDVKDPYAAPAHQTHRLGRTDSRPAPRP